MAGVIATVAAASAVPVSASSLSVEFGRGGISVQFDSPRNQHGGWGWENSRRERGPRAVGSGDIRRILRARGYRNIQNLNRRGAIYQGQAVDRRGQRVGIVVNARDGAILNAYPLR